MKHLLLPVWLLCVASLAAQTAARPLALDEALRLALTNSAQLKKAHYDREILELRLKEGRSTALPQVSASAGLDYYPVLPTQFLPSAIFGGPENAYVPATLGQPWQLGGTVTAQQQIVNEAGRRMAPAANTSRALYDLLATRAEDEVLFNTASVFYQSLQTGQLLRSVKANLDKLDALQKMADLQVANGYGIPLDAKRIRVARTNLETQRQNLLNGIQALHQTLQFLCGIPLEESIAPNADTATPGADSLRWQKIALEVEATTEFRLLQRQLELNQIQTRSLRAEALPTLSAYATAALQAQRPDANFFDTNRRWYGLAVVGFKMQTPVFDGFRRRHKAAQMALEGQKIETDQQQLRPVKQLEFNQARAQVGAALQQLRTQEDNVALARDIAEKLTLQYKSGSTPLTDLLNAQTAQAEAETNYWQQAYAYKLATLKLLKAAGQLHQLTGQ